MKTKTAAARMIEAAAGEPKREPARESKDLPTARAYPLGHEPREMDRLAVQARLFEPITRRLFEAAGLGPGMRVLDVGCGAGDVAFLARRLVGASGEVVGLDKAPEAIATATARARVRRYANVRFVDGDLHDCAFAPHFDAVVGRLVLMYSPDPAAAVRRAAECLRPGGLVIFQEFDMSIMRAVPPAPACDRALGLIARALRAAGAETELGVTLRRVFMDAGLPAPEYRMEAIVSGDAGHPLFQLAAEVTRSLLPVIERHGLAQPGEIDCDALSSRLEAEVTALNGSVVSPGLVGAWARKP